MRTKAYLLVDGYNIIFAWAELKSIAAYSLESARKKLCDILCDYQGMTELAIVVVFDAHLVEGGTGKIVPYNNIMTVFTREAETADNFIERTTRELTRKRDGSVTVATSDHLEQIIIIGRGARRISAQDLWTNINSVREELRERFLDQTPVKKNPLLGRLDAETAKRLDAMRFGK